MSDESQDTLNKLEEAMNGGGGAGPKEEPKVQDPPKPLTPAQKKAAKAAKEKLRREQQKQLAASNAGAGNKPAEDQKPGGAILPGNITLSGDQFQELVKILTNLMPNSSGAGESIMEGERFLARTTDQRYARYPAMNDAQFNDGRSPDFVYMRIEKLPKAWEDELGSRADMLESLGWEIFGHCPQHYYVRKPRKLWEKEDEQPALLKAKQQGRAAPIGAEKGVVVDDPTFEEVSIMELFEELSDADKVKFVSDPKLAAAIIADQSS